MGERDQGHRRVRGLRDLLLISVPIVGLLWLGSAANLFENFTDWLHQRYRGAVDETLFGLLFAVIGLLVFSILRWRVEREESEARIAAESRYRTLVEQMPAVLYTWDPAVEPGSESAPYVSPQITHLLGYSAEEWRDDPRLWRERIHEEDRQRVLHEWDVAVRTHAAFTSEYRIHARDGRLVWLREEAVLVSGDRTVRRHYQGVMYDITARKHAEEQLLEAQERFRALVEQIPAVVYMEDIETCRNIYISPQVQAMFGYTPEEWMADPMLWKQRLHPEDRDRVIAENEAGGSDRWSVEYRTLHRDGHVVWIQNEAILIRDHEGHPVVWQGVAFDVTERKLAEDRLRQAEETYRTLVEQLPVVVYQDAIDDTSTALYVSPQYERLFGYPPEARLNDPSFWIDHLHPEDRDRVLAESERTNRTGDPFVMDYRFFARDGRVVWVRDEAVLHRDRDGTPKYWQGVLVDITQRKLAEETLARRDAILEAVGFAAERFLRARDPEEALPEVLERLGIAAGVSRIDVFGREIFEDGAWAMTIRHGWLAPGVLAIDGTSDRRLRNGWGCGRWEAALSTGTPVVGLVRDLPEGERHGLQAEEVLSLVVVPVFVGDVWWGFLRFDDCATEREWPAAEVEALKAAAETLGAAIGRSDAARVQAETETRYRALVEQMPAVTYVHEPGPGGLVTYVSPQVYSLLGYGPGERRFTHETWMASIHPDDAERVREADERTDSTGEPFDVEYRQIRKDGCVIWVRDTAVLVHDEEGRPLYWQGVRFDITAQKGAEAQLRQAEERYRTMVETLPAIVYVDRANPEATNIFTSAQATAMLGYTPEEWRDTPDLWKRIIHPDDYERIWAANLAHEGVGTVFDEEYRVITKDGRTLWIRDVAVLVADETGEEAFAHGFLFDVTERHLAEDQLRETEAKYRAIVEHVPAAIYVDRPDDSMTTLYVSPQIQEILGVTPQAFLAEPDLWLELIDPDSRAEVRASYLAAVEARRAWVGEYIVHTPDGRNVWVHDETTFVVDERGEPLLLQGVMYDVTERKLAEQALKESERREREAAERLRALDDMKNTFLAAVSHELRSPLTSILGLALTLEQTRMSEEDQVDLLGRLATNARKLDRLLKDLLDIDRLSRGIVTPTYRPTDVGALVRRTVESLDLPGERPTLVEAEPVSVEADPAKVERIVENLLANAARHTGPETGIWVRVWAEPEGAVIAVEDDGPGVPTELQHAIFEPFRQGPTASPHSPGTGIGLSLVAMFTELHGGRAWVQDREGGGASFRVFLPYRPPRAEALGGAIPEGFADTG